MFKTLEMRRVISIVMIALANIIILVHAVVPHHHHDCRGIEGLVFENELTCSCNEGECRECHTSDCHRHRHRSQHPFGNCKLQDLLSKLVLNSRDEKLLVFSLQAPVFDFYNVDFQQINITVPEMELLVSGDVSRGEEIPLNESRNSNALRAPPAICLNPVM